MPGLVLAAVVTAAAFAVAAAFARADGPRLSPVFIAVLVGLLLSLSVPELTGGRAVPGFRLATRGLLRLAIVLLGLRFSLGVVLEVGARGLLVVLAVVATGLTFGVVVGRRLGASPRLAWLVGIGTAICGTSAIAAAAPIVGAEEDEVSVASVIITVFGTAAMVVLPVVGHRLGMDADTFGVLAGAGVHDAAQAIAAGFSFGPEAGGTATIVKLARTSLLVPVLLVLSVVHGRRRGAVTADGGRVRIRVPWYLVGFVAAAAVRTLGDRVLGDAGGWVALLDAVATSTTALLVLAMAAFGLQTRLSALREVGPRAVAAGLTTAVACAVVATLGALTLT
ncbi:YeiH family protein [Egicoccus sp. AB-alg6-2]|uniref:YeiH family protein n=1 Tax=Egicoccus sp. AB-alg6-2 TaxID=3242692 RepID=UPI00359CCA25